MRVQGSGFMDRVEGWGLGVRGLYQNRQVRMADCRLTKLSVCAGTATNSRRFCTRKCAAIFQPMCAIFGHFGLEINFECCPRGTEYGRARAAGAGVRGGEDDSPPNLARAISRRPPLSTVKSQTPCS